MGGIPVAIRHLPENDYITQTWQEISVSQFTTIRKNSKNKIRQLMANALAIYLDVKTSRVDDSYDTELKQVSVGEAYGWYLAEYGKGDSNFRVLQENDQAGNAKRIDIGRSYYFCNNLVLCMNQNEAYELASRVKDEEFKTDLRNMTETQIHFKKHGLRLVA